MLTSSLPGSPEAKRMLREIAARVGARYVLLIAVDGKADACIGFVDQFDAEQFARMTSNAVNDALAGLSLHDVSPMYWAFTDDDTALAYVRRIEGNRLLATAFDLDDELGLPVAVQRNPIDPLLGSEPLVRKL